MEYYDLSNIFGFGIRKMNLIVILPANLTEFSITLGHVCKNVFAKF